jgi:hypothetical protein
MDILSGGIPSPNLLPKGKSVVFGLLSIQQHQELLQTFDPRVKAASSSSANSDSQRRL